MARKKESKLDRALADLKLSLEFYDRAGGDEPAAFLAVVKAFEVSVEYSWKGLKRRIEDKGVSDVIAPKDVVRKAAQIGLIKDAQDWLDYIDARNDSVHDYYGMTQAEFVKLVRAFRLDAGKIF